MEAYVDEVSKIRSFLTECKRHDPEGIYFVELDSFLLKPREGERGFKNRVPRFYDVEFTQSEKMLCQDGRMRNQNVKQTLSHVYRSNEMSVFSALHVMPSAAVHFWNHSRKMVSADAAHLKGQLDGVVNMLTGKDACDRNFSLMYTICSNENAANWNSTCRTFFDAVDHDVKVFISDRDKGLMSVQEKYEKFLPNCAFAACSRHIAKNVGITSAEGQTLVTMLAKAPNQESFDRYSTILRANVGAVKHKALMDLHHRFSFMGLKSKYEDFMTNYGMCNNNASEQQNNKYNEFRDMPYLKGAIHFMNAMTEMITERRLQAIYERDVEKRTVVKYITDQIITNTRSFAAKYSAIVVKLKDVTMVCDGSINQGVFSISYHHGSSTNQVIVELRPTQNDWWARVKCTCNYFVCKGMPCYHAGYVLINLDTIDASTKHLKIALTNILKDPVWKYDNKVWYSPIYTVENMVAQYSPPNLCEININSDELTRHFIFPAPIKPRKGRKRKSRIKCGSHKKKAKTASRKDTTVYVDTVVTFSDSSSDEDDNDICMQEADEALKEAQQLYKASGKPKIAGKKMQCSYCGSQEHNRTACDQKDMSYILSRTKVLKDIVKTAVFNDMKCHSASIPSNKLGTTLFSWLVIDNEGNEKYQKKLYAKLLKRNKTFQEEVIPFYHQN